MRVRLGDIINSQPALGRLATERLAARDSFRVGRLIKELQPALETYEATRKKLLEQYGTLDEGASEYKFADGELDKFAAEVKALLDTEIEVVGEELKLASLDGAKLSGIDAFALAWLVEE